MKKIVTVFVFCFLFINYSLYSQSFDLQFEVDRNDQTVGGFFDVIIQIQSVGSTFKMGTSNLTFEYDTLGLGNPILESTFAFDGVIPPFEPPFIIYSQLTLTEPLDTVVSLNIELATINNGQTVQSTFMNVARVRFEILNTSVSTNLRWRTDLPNRTNVFKDDNATEVPANNLNGKDVSLPIQLASFKVIPSIDYVDLNWITESEIENVGFEVWRSLEEEGKYVVLSSFQYNPSLRGQGNSSTRHEYAYRDELVVGGQSYWYKLVDVAFNGARSEHGPLSVTVLMSDDRIASISSDIPTDFKLHQNYPNPFNPSTRIRFDIPRVRKGQLEASLVIYNSLGQVVRRLYAGEIGAGSFEVEWDGKTDGGNQIPSGIYFLIFKSGYFTEIRRAILLK